MSARGELLAILRRRNASWTDEAEDRAVIDAFKAEVLREAAAAQWAASPWGAERTDCACNMDYCEACDMRRVIDLIDPDKEGSADGAEADRA